MKLLSWNAHGLGNPQGIRILHDLVKKEVPSILFLQETKLHVREFEKCKYLLGFTNCLVVGCVGSSEGIAILWSKDINLVVLKYSKYHIDTCIKEVKGTWYIMGRMGIQKQILDMKLGRC
ncbi:hypothetical protein I3760_07G070900 [Carya illinoinensis]|nr:hypothetical protein I3760_07G070900 [Carya illinoinensis]